MFLHKRINQDMASGLFLLFAAALALVIYNSPLSWLYDQLLETQLTIKLGTLGVDKSLLHWINDGLMAIFFLAIGLEIKNEILLGELSNLRKASLPVLAAIGGVVIPALIYTSINHSNDLAMRGWAVPVATDIAFAVGILALLGSSIPRSLKVLLLSLAIIDDLAAIIIIAVFYTADLSFHALMYSLMAFAVAIVLNRFGVKRIAPYILIGVIMWVCVLKSGVHATLAGVFLAMAIPLKGKHGGKSPLHALEYMLKPWVAFMIMPIFAFANAGLELKDLSLNNLVDPIPLGIILGLFIGKQIGVFIAIWLSVKLRICNMPSGTTWMQIYGLSILCGIGFTMSLFIGSLAFTDHLLLSEVRLGVLVGSTLSGMFGYTLLRYATKG